MFPKLLVYLDGSEDALEVTPCTADLWLAEELTGKSLTDGSEMGLRLILAYVGATGNEPGDVKTVRAWARKHRVNVSVGELVTPIVPGLSAA